MRIATYNIHGWRTLSLQPNYQLITDTLAATEADIIGLNEVVHRSAGDSHAQSALETLADRLGMYHAFGPCLRWPAQDDLPEEAFGNALLSRWPIAANAGHLLTPVEGKEQRGLLEARIQLPADETLTVYVTHLDHTDEEARLTQLRAVREWTLRDRKRPHFVMGDFNAVNPWDIEARPDIASRLKAHKAGQNMVPEGGPQVIERMENAGYTDTFKLCGEPGARSYVPSATPIRIDYIFASQPLADSVQDCVIWQSPGAEGSDHLPVVADVEIPDS